MHHSPTHGGLAPCFTSLLMLSSCSGGFLGARGRGRGNGGVRTTLLQPHDSFSQEPSLCRRRIKPRGDSNLEFEVPRNAKERAPPGHAIMEWKPGGESMMRGGIAGRASPLSPQTDDRSACRTRPCHPPFLSR